MISVGPTSGDARIADVIRDALVWGLIGGLAFLVPPTGCALATGLRASLAVKFGVAVPVTVVAAIGNRTIATRLRENESA